MGIEKLRKNIVDSVPLCPSDEIHLTTEHNQNKNGRKKKKNADTHWDLKKNKERTN